MGTVDLLFVYGSCLRGQAGEGYVAHLPFAPATCRGVLYRSPRATPGLVTDSTGAEIQGEALRFSDPSVLSLLDVFLQAGGGTLLRKRVPITVRGRDLEAWAYVLTHDVARRRGFRRLQATDWRSIAPRRSS